MHMYRMSDQIKMSHLWLQSQKYNLFHELKTAHVVNHVCACLR